MLKSVFLSLTSIYYGVCFGFFLFGSRLILGAWIVPAWAYHLIGLYIKRGCTCPFINSLETINSRDSLLEEFDEQIFNALVEKIEIFTPAHFVFEYEIGGLAK